MCFCFWPRNVCWGFCGLIDWFIQMTQQLPKYLEVKTPCVLYVPKLQVAFKGQVQRH